jgi:DNA-binding CsgD family transcriptional regulator
VQLARSGGWGSLTDSELRVARLVAQGATNRDAADQLFLSPHTVSTHLRHTFAKLGINSRVELARIAVKEDTAAIEPT